MLLALVVFLFVTGLIVAVYFASVTGAKNQEIDRRLREVSASQAAPEIAAADYFDRLALDRARDVIGDAKRKLTAAVLESGAWGAAAVAAWAATRKAEVERVRAATGAMASSGLTVSKLAVAASMLEDLTHP